MSATHAPYRFRGIAIAAAVFAAWAGHLLYALRLEAPGLLQILLHVFVQSKLAVGLFITAHDAMHGPVAPRHRRLNDAIGAAAVFLYAGFFYGPLRRLHHAHHANPASARDPDFAPGGDERFWPWLWRFFTRYYSWKNLAVMHVLVGALWLYAGDVAPILLFYAVPGWISALQLFYFGTYLPHRTPPGGHHHPHRARSNNYPVWLSFLTCYHFGYHEEHHDHPGAPWWRLPTVRRARLAAGKGAR